MLLGLNLPLTCGIREPFPALVQPCWQCPSCTLYHRPDHSINGQFLYSPETNLDWGHTLYSVKLENRAVVSLCLHYHTRLSGGTWKQKKPKQLVYVRKPLFRVESWDKPDKWSEPRTRELFRLVTASTVAIHSFETITFPVLFCTMISKEATSWIFQRA